jgi:septum formation protein
VADATTADRSTAGDAAPGAAAPPVLVLASASRRRRELLERLGLHPVIRPAELDEQPLPDEDASTLVRRLALAKATASAAAAPAGVDEVVLAADTEVAVDDRALGKPADLDAAVAMLTALAGRTHAVRTGLAVRRGAHVVADEVVTTVTFRPLTAAEIDWYVATGEPWGKAGAYALQGVGAVLVERIDGSDTNVIGLPLPATVALLRQVGFDPIGRLGSEQVS